jgi:hypothetical protein
MPPRLAAEQAQPTPKPASRPGIDKVPPRQPEAPRQPPSIIDEEPEALRIPDEEPEEIPVAEAAESDGEAYSDEPALPLEIENCVAELNAFCQQLEADRRAVEEDVRQLEQRGNAGAALAERDRASLSGEQAQLNLLREELRLELERLQRADESKSRWNKKTAHGTERKPAAEAPKKDAPEKARGSFLGLRRWLGK